MIFILLSMLVNRKYIYLDMISQKIVCFVAQSVNRFYFLAISLYPLCELQMRICTVHVDIHCMYNVHNFSCVLYNRIVQCVGL